jgi:methylenetetrahydrofolate reductase (NADPH)
MAKVSELLAVGRTFSIEFFPPKSAHAQISLGRTIAELEKLRPAFVSVTYGAGGSTRERTHEVVTWVRKETSISPMAHLTCVGHTKAELTEILEGYRDAGIENILALGGDPPAGAEVGPSDFSYADELLDFVNGFGGFSVGVAAHPEGHPRSPDRISDRNYLANKMRRANFGVTQFFFEIEPYVEMMNDLRDLGVDKPILPGIMPITNLNSIQRMAAMSGSQVPRWLVERLEPYADDAVMLAKAGVEAASELCQELLDAGAPGLHFYTMNKSNATNDIWTNLGLTTLR